VLTIIHSSFQDGCVCGEKNTVLCLSIMTSNFDDITNGYVHCTSYRKVSDLDAYDQDLLELRNELFPISIQIWKRVAINSGCHIEECKWEGSYRRLNKLTENQPGNQAGIFELRCYVALLVQIGLKSYHRIHGCEIPPSYTHIPPAIRIYHLAIRIYHLAIRILWSFFRPFFWRKHFLEGESW